jgi:hypothetical protein
MDQLTLWMVIGFLLAAYSVIANDSVQTLGTWIASNNERFNWKILWLTASAVLLWALWFGWYMHGGDISYGRLTKIPFQEIQWYHAAAPAILLLLTRVGVPVSTSFLVLSAFASTFVLEKMLMKSIMGYAIAAISAYALWHIISRVINEKKPITHHWTRPYWRAAQWCTTGLLWWTWLSHDMANIAVFLPRQVSWDMMIMISFVFIVLLGFMFREGGGKIQNIVLEKQTTRYIRSATLIDLVYFVILYFFKELNSIPMSTTWVFVGLLTGRELAIATVYNTKMKQVFPLVTRDFMKMMIGLGASVGIVLFIHYIIIPNGY